MLAQAFSIPYEDKEPPHRSQRKPQQETPEQRFRRMERYCFRVLCDYRNLLRRWKRDYAPKTPDEDFHPLFVEALQKQGRLYVIAPSQPVTVGRLEPDLEKLGSLYWMGYYDTRRQIQEIRRYLVR